MRNALKTAKERKKKKIKIQQNNNFTDSLLKINIQKQQQRRLFECEKQAQNIHLNCWKEFIREKKPWEVSRKIRILSSICSNHIT